MHSEVQSVGPGRVAVFADLHYTCEAAKIKGGILRKAFAAAKDAGADAVVCAGDMLGNGTVAEATALRSIIDAQPLPVWLTPGNAELRTPAESAAAARALSMSSELPEGILTVDSSCGAPSSLPDAPSAGLVITHIPPNAWGQAPYAAWRAWTAAHGNPLVVAGHDHVDDVRDDGCIVLRGLDPDKAIGGPPSFAIFSNGDGRWRLERKCEIDGIAPETWTDDFRAAFLGHLGISAMSDPFGGLAFAAQEAMPALELRYGSWPEEETPKVIDAIGKWRAAGGRYLSMHLPEVCFGTDGTKGVDALTRSSELARKIGCDRVTLHVPRIPVGEYTTHESEVYDGYARGLAPLAGSGVLVGIENMHMAPSGETPEHRSFGYTPAECKTVIGLVRQIPGVTAGYHCDIGHVRNNAPYSTLFPVSAWYELLGRDCNGMHIHQVTMDANGVMENHMALLGFYDKLIALSSLVIALRDGLIPPVPMYIEVRRGRGPESYLALKRLVEEV